MEKIIINIDGVDVEHEIDANGNATLNGEIKFTKEVVEDLKNVQTTEETTTTNDAPDTSTDASQDANNDVEEVTFDTIAAASGISVTDEEGNPKTYEMTMEGLSSWAKDIHESAIKAGQDTALEALFEHNPDLYDMYRYKQEHGNLDGYAVRVNYNEIDINDTTDDEVLYNIIYNAEIAQGKTKERAKKIADYSKNNESLKDDANDSLEILKRIHQNEENARREAAEAEARKIQEEEERYYGVTYERGKEKVLNIEGSMYDLVVNKGTVGDLFIPPTGIKTKTKEGKDKVYTRKELFDYMSKPVKEIGGIYYTQAQLDEYTRMQNIQNATQQFLLNLTGRNAVDSLLSRAATNKVIKIMKTNSANAAKPVNKGNASGNSNSKPVLPV